MARSYSRILTRGNDDIVAEFAEGNDCAGGKARIHTRVTAGCGRLEKVTSVRKNNDCSYTMSITAPFMCRGNFYRTAFLSALVGSFN